MGRWTADDAEVAVFTFKEGLLSPVAHDLELAVRRFEIEWDEADERIEARFDATSVRVLRAVQAGRPLEGALSDADKRRIEATIAAEVLRTARHPEIRFVSQAVTRSGDGALLRGTLELVGRSRELEVPVRRDGARWVAQAVIHQPDFGIVPYRALLGTLRLRPDVHVRITAPAAGDFPRRFV